MSRPGESPGPGAPGSGAVVRGKFRPARVVAAKARPPAQGRDARPVRRTNAARLARQLALAHWIERVVEEGQVAEVAAAVRSALGTGPTTPRRIEGNRQALMPYVALLAVLPLGFVLYRRNF